MRTCPECQCETIWSTCMGHNNRHSCTACNHQWQDNTMFKEDDWTENHEDKLQERINELNISYGEKIDGLEDKVMTLSRNNLDLMGKKKMLESRINELEQEVSSLESEIESLNDYM